MLSCLGNDTLGQEALEVIKSYNVNHKYIYFNDKKTGQCIVTLDENKIPTFSLVKDVAFDSIIHEVKSGKSDIGIAGISYSDERAKQVAFSDNL